MRFKAFLNARYFNQSVYRFPSTNAAVAEADAEGGRDAAEAEPEK